ncbi:MAG TPA: ABC transporter ATP-binding protein [Chloroflexota bacterium]|nr:ABC transporter ATP-binding protein [Chloroflexota bacterium]
MSILGRLLSFAYRYRTFTILAYVCLLATIALGLVQPLIIKEVFDRGIGEQDVQFLLVASGLLLVTNVANSIFNFGVSYLNEFVSQRVAYDLRNALYDHLQHLSFGYHDRAKTGELMSRVTSDVDSARIFTGQGVLQSVNMVVIYVAILALMFSLHWQLALLALATMPFVGFTAVQYGTRVRPLFSRMQRQWAQLTAVLQENITGVRVVKAFAREDFEIDKFKRENEEFLQRNIAATRLQALVYPLMLFITAIGTILIIWFGGREVIVGNLTLGTLLAFNSYLARLAQPTRQLGVIISWVSRASASGERLFEILDAPSPVSNRPGARPMPPIEGRVVFDQVSFSYGQPPPGVGSMNSARFQPVADRITDSGIATRRDRQDGQDGATKGETQTEPRQIDGRGNGAPRETPAKGETSTKERTLFDDSLSISSDLVLRDINLVAEPDQVVALIGHTGSGKSTLVSLIPRFYDVSEGAVLIDGIDVRDVELQSLRRQIGIVLQELLLFSATVSENIAYGRPEATQEEIERAARAAQAYEFISELSEGFDTKVGERGVTLSGGQRQRLAIARALLIDPRILILDDATASVDMRTEYLIQQALQTLMKGRTTFVIAQRLTTIKQADHILVMDHGRIVQRGKHEELVAQLGPYHEIYDLQLRDQEEVLSQMRAPAVQ